jgi:hypothetical protein
VFADLARGRCFITQEELGNRRDVHHFAATPTFVERRVQESLRFAGLARQAIESFGPEEARAGATRLSDAWEALLRSGQVRPSQGPLEFDGRFNLRRPARR